MVLQPPLVFPTTLRENIAYGRPQATEAEIARAAHLAQLDGLLARMPQGLATPVGEQGATLSDGEPDLEGLRAFMCVPGQGVNYRPGVWHHGIIALDMPAEFAMLVWEDGTSGDCEERSVEQAGITLLPPLTGSAD